MGTQGHSCYAATIPLLTALLTTFNKAPNRKEKQLGAMAAEVQGQMLPPGAAQGAVGGNQYGVDVQNLFTRGNAVPESRGETMVQKHERMMQEAKEERAMEKIRALLPLVSTFTCHLALKEAHWDVEHAVMLIRSFQSDMDQQLQELQQVWIRRTYVPLERLSLTVHVQLCSPAVHVAELLLTAALPPLCLCMCRDEPQPS